MERKRKKENRRSHMRNRLLCYLLSGALALTNLAIIPTLTVSAEELTEHDDGSQETLQPKVIVSSYDELSQAIDEAEDGDIIGIDSVIQIEDDNIVLGNNTKRISIIRSARKSGIEISGKNPVINNIVFDGNGIEYKDIFYPMLDAKNGGKFTDLEIRNCHNNIWGAALKITGGTVVVSDCNFHDNVGSESAHIGVMGAEDISIYRSIFKNGHVENCAGAIGVYSKGMSALIKDCIITGNHADGYAGGIVNWGNLTLSNTVIYGNTALCGADIMNYPDSEFHMDSLEQIKEIYESVSIIPKEWIADYDDEVLQGVNPSGIYDKNAYLRLVYEEIPKEESNKENEGSGKDNSSKENNNEDDSAADNNDNTNDKKDENNIGDATVPDNGNTGDSNSGKGNSEEGTTADSEKGNDNKGNDSIENNENQENQEDKKENQGNGDMGNNENKDGSSSDSNLNGAENPNNNMPNTSTENGNQTSNSSVEKPNTNNNGFSSGSTTPSSEGNKQPDSTVNNENQGGVSAGNTGNNSSSNNQNQSNKPVSGNTNNATNGNVSDNTNSGSSSSLGNGNTSDNTYQSGGTVSPKPEDGKDFVPSDKEGTAAITDNPQTSVSDTNKDDLGNKNTVTKKKVIKKLKVTAKRGKRKISGKTIKRATIKIIISKKTYTTKSNEKGKFTIKLKGKMKLKKGQKVKVTVAKKGYKTKSRTLKVK